MNFSELKKPTSRKILKIIILLAILGVGLYIWNFKKNAIYIDTSGESPITLIGGGGERIYLDYGVIYAFRDDPDRGYNIVNNVFHVTSEQYKKILFFSTPEEAEAAGFQPSKYFAEDYECWKQGRDWFDCRAEKRKKATTTSS